MALGLARCISLSLPMHSEGQYRPDLATNIDVTVGDEPTFHTFVLAAKAVPFPCETSLPDMLALDFG